MGTVTTDELRRQPDHFDLFVQMCQAAGVPAGAERIGILLALQDETRQLIWLDVAARLENEEAGE